MRNRGGRKGRDNGRFNVINPGGCLCPSIETERVDYRMVASNWTDRFRAAQEALPSSVDGNRLRLL